MVWPHDYIALGLAILFGAAFGGERERSGKTAGLRTNVVICLGAAVFTICAGNFGEDSDSAARIVAQIITGVGFLGAGAIIRDQSGVHGLTTAATIWLVAGVGMACGLGMYLLAALTTGIAVLVLAGLGRIESRIAHGKNREFEKNPPIDTETR